MILEGMFFENVMMHKENLIYPQYPTISAGTKMGTEAIYRYGLRESSYPTLSLVDELTDGQGNIIPAGHYELALSDDRQFLIIIEKKQPIAVMRVFKVEVSMDKKPQVHDRKSLRAKKKKDKERIKANRKLEREGMPLISDEEDVYQQADIEYIKDGDYYLIRYERGDVKAWAAIKS